jgi:hypothetical protein
LQANRLFLVEGGKVGFFLRVVLRAFALTDCDDVRKNNLPRIHGRRNHAGIRSRFYTDRISFLSSVAGGFATKT